MDISRVLIKDFWKQEISKNIVLVISFLSGGETASFVFVDALVRLLPGVLGNENSVKEESFENFLLEYPQYTKPREWEGKRPPEVLFSGDHAKIKRVAFISIRGYNTSPET